MRVVTLLVLFTGTLLAQPSAGLVQRCDLIRDRLDRFRHTGDAELLSAARRDLQEAAQQDPVNFEVKKLEVWAAILDGHHEQGLELALALNKRMPDDLEVYGYLVDAYRKLGKLDLAEAQATWMLRLRPENRETLRRVAQLRESFADFEGALQMWNNFYRRTPAMLALDRAYALARIAHLMAPSNRQRATAIAKEALRIAPTSMEARKVLSEVSEDSPASQAKKFLEHMRQTAGYGYLDRARKLISKALHDNPKDYEALRVDNEIALFLHEFSRAAKGAQQLAQVNPRDAANWAMLGDALMETGDYDAAAGAYQKMVDLQPGLMSYNRIAWYRYVTGDPDGAVEMMLRAVQAGRSGTEHTAWVLMELGHLYWRMGKLAEAEQAYRASLGNFSHMHGAWAGLAQVHGARGNLQQAVEAAKKAQAMAQLVEYGGLLADLYLVLDQPAEAQRQLELVELQARLEAASGQKGNRGVALILANHNRNLKDAIEAAEADLAVRKDVFTWDAYSWALLQAGRIEQAEQASQQALRAGTPDPLLYYHAGMISIARGDSTRGARLLKQALSLHPNFDIRQAAVAKATLAALDANSLFSQR